jgi:hypothetical protein
MIQFAAVAAMFLTIAPGIPRAADFNDQTLCSALVDAVHRKVHMDERRARWRTLRRRSAGWAARGSRLAIKA